MATKQATRQWKSARFDSDARMCEFIAALDASEGGEIADRAKVVNAPWGYTIFYPESA